MAERKNTVTFYRSGDRLMRLQCDQCTAQAYVVVVDPTRTLELHFCHHHYTGNEWALVSKGWTVRLDKREELLVRP